MKKESKKYIAKGEKVSVIVNLGKINKLKNTAFKKIILFILLPIVEHAENELFRQNNDML